MATLLERARSEGTPLVDGEQVTYVWHGDRPPVLLGEFNDFDPGRAPRLEPVGPRVWVHRTHYPADAYLEYVWATHPDYQGTSDAHSVLDPFNPHHKPNGVGGTVNYLYMPGRRPTDLVRRHRGTARGELTRHLVDTGGMAHGAQRRVALYRPATDGPVPLLVVLDGNDYLKQARIDAIVDNLIAGDRIAPLAMALVWNGPPRFAEYACSEATLEFLLGAVLPLAGAHLDLSEGHGILGASMGGVMALFAGLRAPAAFTKVYGQAGAFAFGGRRLVVHDLAATADPAAPTIRIDNGTFDFLYEAGVEMHGVLRDRGFPVTYNEYRAGHNYYAWRDELPGGLADLFPPGA